MPSQGMQPKANLGIQAFQTLTDLHGVKDPPGDKSRHHNCQRRS